MLLGGMAGFLLPPPHPQPEEKGKRLNLQTRYCLLLSSLSPPLSPFLALSVCILLLVHWLPLSAAPPSPPASFLFFFSFPRTLFVPTASPGPCSTSGTARFQVSQTFPGIALLTHSHFYPLPLPQVPDPENVTMGFLRCVRLNGRGA